MDEMSEACRREVLELHEFFEAWFTGRASATEEAFGRVAGALGDSTTARSEARESCTEHAREPAEPEKARAAK